MKFSLALLVKKLVSEKTEETLGRTKNSGKQTNNIIDIFLDVIHTGKIIKYTSSI